MTPAVYEPMGLILLAQLLYTLAVSAIIALLIWYACRRERGPFARSDTR